MTIIIFFIIHNMTEKGLVGNLKPVPDSQYEISDMAYGRQSLLIFGLKKREKNTVRFQSINN